VRYGTPVAWHYYLTAGVSSCAGGVVSVTFTVPGAAATTVRCGAKVRLGPLTPKRSYRISASANDSRGAKIALATSTVYLPGDDGNWVRCNPSNC
jgi:hypothetical protein